jgi:hypothetical protein
LQTLQLLINSFFEHLFDADDFNLLLDFAKDGNQLLGFSFLLDDKTPLLGEANPADVLLPPVEVLEFEGLMIKLFSCSEILYLSGFHSFEFPLVLEELEPFEKVFRLDFYVLSQSETTSEMSISRNSPNSSFICSSIVGSSKKGSLCILVNPELSNFLLINWQIF